MTIDFSQKLKNPLTGETVFKSPQSKEASTLGEICVNALVSPLKGDETLSGTQKFEFWGIARKVHENQALATEEVAKIKERVGKMYSALLVGIVYELLEK